MRRLDLNNRRLVREVSSSDSFFEQYIVFMDWADTGQAFLFGSQLSTGFFSFLSPTKDSPWGGGRWFCFGKSNVMTCTYAEGAVCSGSSNSGVLLEKLLLVHCSPTTLLLSISSCPRPSSNTTHPILRIDFSPSPKSPTPPFFPPSFPNQ